VSDGERHADLDDLLAALCDGALASDEHARLQTMLREDERARERAVEVLELEGLLVWHYGAVAGTLGTSAAYDDVQPGARANGPRMRRRAALVSGLVAAAALVLAVTTFRRQAERDVAVELAPQWALAPSEGARYAVLAPDLVQLEHGELFVRSRTSGDAPPLDIRTSAATAEARGTSFYISTHSPEEDPMLRDITRVLVLGGTVTLTNSFGEIEAGPGALAVADQDRAPSLVVAAGANALACDLYGQIAAAHPPGASFCYSPYSIATALAMLVEGADGETAKELAAALHVPEAARRHGGDVARLPFEWNLLHPGHADLRALFDSAARATAAQELQAQVAALGARREELE
jgi:hypothetical protein